jgi:hypothetical protein
MVEPELVTVGGVNEALAPEGKPLTVNATVPAKPVDGVTVAVKVAPPPPGEVVWEAGVTDRAKSEFTVIVRVSGLGSVRPVLSVTVNEAVKVPDCGYVTAPGFASKLVPGVPPGKTQEYPVMVPFGLVPVPEKDTDWPAAIVTLLAGLVITPVGGWSFGALESWTNCAREGTPEAFKMKSM